MFQLQVVDLKKGAYIMQCTFSCIMGKNPINVIKINLSKGV